MAISLPVQGNRTLEAVLQRVNEHVTLHTWWYCCNINAINRMHINDHGPVHIKIVSNIALKLLRLLREVGVTSSIACDHKLTEEDAEVVVLLAVCFHDIGHIVHRDQHEPFSVGIAIPLLRELLADVYEERERAIVISEVVHAIFAHDTHVEPFTVEAGCVKVADALDMEQGRARIPFSLGEPTIHAVSALAIEKVSVTKGEAKPICITVKMTNSAGIFQLDNLLKGKVQNSGLSQYIEIKAHIEGEEKKIVEHYNI